MSEEGARFLFTTVCDDVRQEVGNKVSMMGIYDQAIVVERFPVVIPRIYFVLKARTSADKPFQKLTFVVRRDEEIMIEAEMDAERITAALQQADSVAVGPDKLDPADRIFMVTAVLGLTPLTLDKPCRLRFRAITESGVLRGGSLAIDVAPAQENSAASGSA